jgi:hypothetical protein
MSKSVSNDALWEKLSEIEEKINQSLMEQKAPVQAQEQRDLTPEIKATKDEIIEKLEKYIQGLGTHCDKHFKFLQSKVGKLENDMADAIACLVHLVKESGKQQNEKDTQSYFNFSFFKVKKTSLVIAVLGILVFILTLFSMKQQNDYSLLMDEYYRQRIEIKERQVEVDSLRNIGKQDVKKKK